MNYRTLKDGTQVSILGYGCLRFSKNGAKIDLEKTEKEIMAAIDAGVNYFDTAYAYLGSEEALGQILERNQARERVQIATKLPHYFVKSAKSLDKYFETEKKRLRTDHVEVYLIHMLPDLKVWNRLCGLGIREWFAQKKAAGEIKHVGFSFHGNSDTFCDLVDVYDWDIVQIQYNYLDEHTQAGRRGLMYASEKGIPVVIMEPLRGGRLVNYLPKGAKYKMEEYSVKRTPAEWALRWLWDQPEVTCVLSGMNSSAMVEENCKIAADAQTGAFTPEDHALIETVREEIKRAVKVGCTGCGYCMPCPHGVDIPNTFRCYNQMFLEDKKSVRMEYFQVTGMNNDKTDASLCTQCGACERHCPQQIPIRKELINARKALQPPHIKVMMKVVRRFMKA